MINVSTDDWTIKNIDTVLFDKDGTFIDLHYFWGEMTRLRVERIISEFGLSNGLFNELCFLLGYNVNNRLMEENGITALYSRSKIIEIFRNDLLKYGVNTTEKKLTELFDEVNISFYKNINEYTKPIEAAINFIKNIKARNIKTGIVTSDSVESAMLTLKYFHWENLFDVVIGRESSHYTKESGEPTKLALSKLSSAPETTLMTGDAPMDYISAKNAGIQNTILVASGQICKENLLKTTHYAVNSMKELIITNSTDIENTN